jgi:fructose-bisphosphate aldolase class I
VILFAETLEQPLEQPSNATKNPVDSITISQAFNQQGILTGIKVDQGLTPIADNSAEKMTKGLDNLADNLTKYKHFGVTFAKWRAVINIDSKNQLPSDIAIKTNAEQLAMYAAICQSLGIVPIVEPEVLMDGDHDLNTCAAVTEKVLLAVFRELVQHQIQLEHILLKPNMVLPGKNCPNNYTAEEIAVVTIKVLKNTVPASVPSINFLSGGQSEDMATTHLNAINKLGIAPWHLSFSFGRALQESCILAWSGQDNNIANAQKVLLERSKANSLANLGVI